MGYSLPEIFITQSFSQAVPLSGMLSLLIFRGRVLSLDSDLSLNVNLFQSTLFNIPPTFP